jgi:hypothetical protein
MIVSMIGWFGTADWETRSWRDLMWEPGPGSVEARSHGAEVVRGREVRVDLFDVGIWIDLSLVCEAHASA